MPAVKAVLAVLLLVLAMAPGCLEDIYGVRTVQPYDYLRDNEFTEWTIEVDWGEGARPSSHATQTLKDRMQELAKKDQIQVQVDQAPLDVKRQEWDSQSILELHERALDRETGGKRVVTHVLYLPGTYEGERVLGVTIGFDVIALFPDSMRSACTLERLCFFSQQDVETAVLVHEFGHAIGLVNRGLPMVNDHEDKDHPHHSSNSRSVMYWAVETGSGLPLLESIPTRFDTNDKRDVCAGGGRCS